MTKTVSHCMIDDVEKEKIRKNGKFLRVVAGRFNGADGRSMIIHSSLLIPLFSR